MPCQAQAAEKQSSHRPLQGPRLLRASKDWKVGHGLAGGSLLGSGVREVQVQVQGKSRCAARSVERPKPNSTVQPQPLHALCSQNGNQENPSCCGIDGILEAYHRSLRTVQLYGPTNFAPVVTHVARCPCHGQDP